ncbi:hypothetical protein [Enhygromyxa salina]|uniref:hypothetical protein n=1 Tax=Enhygromyxa salina TaxID=215803 RepID=UPI000D088980|nr:hypothetical protein [Enhygromyxa salina]
MKSRSASRRWRSLGLSLRERASPRHAQGELVVPSSGQVELELARQSWPRTWWRPRPEADVGEDPRDIVSSSGREVQNTAPAEAAGRGIK